MNPEEQYQVEEDFRCSHAELDHTAFREWIGAMSQELSNTLIKASAVSTDVKEVSAYFLELCAIRYIIETKATA